MPGSADDGRPYAPVTDVLPVLYPNVRPGQRRPGQEYLTRCIAVSPGLLSGSAIALTGYTRIPNPPTAVNILRGVVLFQESPTEPFVHVLLANSKTCTEVKPSEVT